MSVWLLDGALPSMVPLGQSGFVNNGKKSSRITASPWYRV